MNNSSINQNQMKYVLALFFIGSSLVGGTSAKAQQDSWISILIAAVLMIPMVFLYNGILRLYPGKNLFQIMIAAFGNIIGKILCGIYVLYAIHLGSLSLNVFSAFISVVNMPNTPLMVITWFMILPCIYLVYKGTAALGTLSKFLYPFVFVFVFFTIILAIKDMNFENIFPVLESDGSALMNSTFNVFSLPMAEMILPLALFSYDKKANSKKTMFLGILLGLGILLAANLRNRFILGSNVELYPFSSYQAVSIISISDFLTRMEVIIGINLLIAGFIKIAVCCFVASIGLAEIFGIPETKKLVIPASLLMVALKINAFDNSVELLKFVDVYKYYVVPYQLIIPIVLLIAGAVKQITAKLKSANEQKE